MLVVNHLELMCYVVEYIDCIENFVLHNSSSFVFFLFQIREIKPTPCIPVPLLEKAS